MATRQPLRGTSEKLYDVISNFNKGIDKKTADDVSLDSSFKDLQNFYNAAEGYLSKRPGAYNSNLSNFIQKIILGEYDKSKIDIVTNDFGESNIKDKLNNFYKTIILSEVKEGTEIEGTKFIFQLDKIIGFQMLKNSYFLEFLQNLDKVFNGEELENINSSVFEFACVIVGGGLYHSVKNNIESSKKPGLSVSRLYIKAEYTNNKYDIKIEIDSVDPTMNPYKGSDGLYKCRWDYFPDGYIEGTEGKVPAMSIDISNYNGYSYIATGSNYICRIEQFPESRVENESHSGESNIIVQIGGYEGENLYKPTAIEVNQIGFNVLSKDPLSYIDKTGSTSKTKGVFYSIDVTNNGETFKQPITKVPYNAPFYMHVLYTGSTAPTEIKYRPDNGETDITINPYKNFPGKWYDSEKTIWKCDGIDSDQKFELYIKLGDDEFRTYVDTTSSPIDETGYINEISKLVFSSTHSKIINNQLVLYGGHGYIFFSEYDDFRYFPNYFYVYIASEAGEESVTNITYFRQFYAIFTNKRIKRMAGAFGADDFGIYPLSDYIGCPNGRTVRSVGNNLLFLGNDGIYKLKQGYLGEGTENIEKIDEALDGELNLNNVLQAFTLNNNYIVIKNDGRTWIVFNTITEAFYKYVLESETGLVYEKSELDEEMLKKTLPFYSAFQSTLYDANGDFLIVPMYSYNFNENYTYFTHGKTDFMIFRFNDLDFLEEDKRHADGNAFISKLETHAINMGYPTHTKKFKDIYIKLFNESGHAIPLYVTIKVDDTIVIDPSNYFIHYDEKSDTFYYLERIENNAEINIGKALGAFTLGVDKLGQKTIQQIRFRVRTKGRSIKIILSDGYDDYTTSTVNENHRGIPTRKRNLHDFSLSTIGIKYKLKKVKEG